MKILKNEHVPSGTTRDGRAQVQIQFWGPQFQICTAEKALLNVKIGLF